MWSATITITGQPNGYVSQASRDGVIEYALRFVPDAYRDDVRSQLASRWLWLFPNRLASWPGGTVTITKGDVFASRPHGTT